MPKVYLSNFVKGANQAINPLLIDDNALKVQNGMVTSHKLGALLKRLGYQRVANVAEASKSITGLFNFRQSASTQKILATVNNSAGTNLTLKYNNAGTWTD